MTERMKTLDKSSMFHNEMKKNKKQPAMCILRSAISIRGMQEGVGADE